MPVIRKKTKKAQTFKYNRLNTAYFLTTSFLVLLALFLINLYPQFKTGISFRTPEIYPIIGGTDFPPDFFRKIIFGYTLLGQMAVYDPQNPITKTGYVDGFWLQLPDLASYNDVEVYFRSCPNDGDSYPFNNCQPGASFIEKIWIFDSQYNFLGSANHTLDFSQIGITQDKIYYLVVGSAENSVSKIGFYKISLDYKYRSTGIKARFRGVDSNRGEIAARFKIYKPWDSISPVLDLGVINFKAADNGDYLASLSLPAILFDFDNHTLLIKGSKHLQRRFDNIIFIKDGVLDFTNKLMEPGDLPLPQDGVANGQDLDYLWYRRGSRNTAELNIGDLNFDGAINMGDISLILETFKNPWDEEL